jgi:hypothetical protein
MLPTRRTLTTFAILAGITFGGITFGQFGGGFGGRRGVVYQNDPPDTEFIFARWHYGTGGYRSDGWAHDYPTAEQHILQVMTETSLINVENTSYRVVELSSDEIFDYPFSYISEPGEMWLTDQEVENLREYIDRGGFVMVDDFGGQGQGPREFEIFRENLQRAFPDREMIDLTINHPIFHALYDIDSVNAIHPMSLRPSIFFGYPDGHGGLSMIVCYSADIGDFWEYIDNPVYPAEPSAEALKLGLNFVQYAMTH